jgi:hypothetical protein
MVGRSHGAARWHSKYDDAVFERDAAIDTAKYNADEVVKLGDAIDRHNEAIAKMERDHRDQLNGVLESHRVALARQATSYQRAIEERDRSAAELRERVRLLSVAETCHEAWLEVASD